MGDLVGDSGVRTDFSGFASNESKKQRQPQDTLRLGRSQKAGTCSRCRHDTSGLAGASLNFGGKKCGGCAMRKGGGKIGAMAGLPPIRSASATAVRTAGAANSLLSIWIFLTLTVFPRPGVLTTAPLPRAYEKSAVRRRHTMATQSHPDSFKSKSTLTSGKTTYEIFRLKALEKQGVDLTRLPFSLRILLENLLRHEDGRTVTADDIKFLASWDPKAEPSREIAYMPARVLMQDFTGVPAIVDLAAMRDAMRAGRRSGEDQSAAAGGAGDRPLGAGG